MKVSVTLTEEDLQRLVYQELQERLGSIIFSSNEVVIEVKSKQNYKSEWEPAAFRATVVKEVKQ